MLIAFLLAVVVGLTALNLYQDKVIEKQRYELQWLMTHATIRMEAPQPKPGAGAQPTPAPAAMKSEQKPNATPAPVATEAAAAVAPNAATAKP